MNLSDYVHLVMRELLTIEQFKNVYLNEDVRKADREFALNPTEDNRERLLLTLKKHIDTLVTL